jgi:aminopeptidase N
MLLEPGCQRSPASVDPEPGIPQILAAERARTISNLRYDLSFDIPPAVSDPIQANVVIRFVKTASDQPVVLDFVPGASAIRSVSVRQWPYCDSGG